MTVNGEDVDDGMQKFSEKYLVVSFKKKSPH